MKKVWIAAAVAALLAWVLLLLGDTQLLVLLATACACLAGVALFVNVLRLLGKVTPKRKRNWIWVGILVLLGLWFYWMMEVLGMDTILTATLAGKALYVLQLLLLVFFYGALLRVLWTGIEPIYLWVRRRLAQKK